MPFIFKRFLIQVDGESPSESWLNVPKPGSCEIVISVEYRTVNEDDALPISVRLTAGSVQDHLSGQRLEPTDGIALKTFRLSGVVLSPDIKEVEMKIAGTGCLGIRRFRVRTGTPEAMKA